jgi:hypothetical protein
MRIVVGLYMYTYVYVCARKQTGGGRRFPSAQIWSMRKFVFSAAPGSSLRILHNYLAPGFLPLPWSCVNVRHASAFPRYVYAYGREMATRTQTWKRRAWGEMGCRGPSRVGVRTTRGDRELMTHRICILQRVFFRIKRGPWMDEARPWWRVTALLVCLCLTLVGLWQFSAQPARSGERPECVFPQLIHTYMAMAE